MIDNYLYQYLVSFYKTGSLKKTAELYGVTSASISRGLKKLEHDLQVPLFIHHPQKLELTDTGLFTVKEAERILKLENNLPNLVQNYHQKKNLLSVGASTPAVLQILKKSSFKDLKISNLLLSPDRIKMNLTSHRYQLIISSRKITDPQITSTYLGEEKLAVLLTPLNPLYNNKKLSFNSLSNLEFVVLKNLGEWRKIFESNIPNIKLILQQNITSYNELIEYSNFPLFKSSLSLNDPRFIKNDKRKLIPIIDSSAKIRLYASYLNEDKARITKICQKLSKKINKANESFSSTLFK